MQREVAGSTDKDLTAIIQIEVDQINRENSIKIGEYPKFTRKGKDILIDNINAGKEVGVIHARDQIIGGTKLAFYQ